MIDLFISAFVTLFVVIDPPGCAPIYASLTTGASAAQRRSMAIRATLIAGFILIFFAMFGEALLSFLHIDLDSFRIAGGVMLFIIAIDMVFEKRTERREQRAEKLMATPEVEDVSVFPMAMPMLAGPGSIASVMLLVSQNSGLERALVIFGALLLVLLLTLDRQQGRGCHHPPARCAARGARGAVRHRRAESELLEPRLTRKRAPPAGDAFSIVHGNGLYCAAATSACVTGAMRISTRRLH